MKRSEFVKTCGMGCVGLITTGAFLQSCATTSYLTTNLNDGKINLSQTSFLKDNQKGYKRLVIAKAPEMDYPIVVYREASNKYRAFILSCTHRKTELNVSGDLLSCPSHGSEFSSYGKVISGPAKRDLRSLPVEVSGDNISVGIS